MKVTTKILLCLLAVCMLLGTFASCKGKKKPTTDPTGEDTTTSNPEDVAPKTYGGDTINILVRGPEQYRREWFVDGDASNALEEKIVARNEKVCKDLDVEIEFKQSTGETVQSYTEKVMNAYRAALGDYDIVSSFAAMSTAPAAMGCFINLYDTNKFPNFHFNEPYWNQSYISAAEVDGYLFTVCGDVNLSVFDRTIVTYLNKDAAKDHGIDLDDLYATVLAGDWTYEKFYQIVSDIGYEEKDHEEGATDGDFYALTAIKGSEASDAFVQAFDLKIISKDDAGNYSLADGSDLDKLDAAMNKIKDLYYNSNGAIVWKPTTEDSATYRNYVCFTSGNAIFNIDVIYHYESGLAMMRNADFDIGMIPVPKYDANQANYKASVQDAHNVMSVMFYTRSSDTHYEAISALLEALCKETYEDIRPFYFERMVKTKYVSGAEDAQVFDMILASTAWDFADVYNANLATGSDEKGPRERVWRASFNANTSVVDACGILRSPINTKIDELLAWMKAHRF